MAQFMVVSMFKEGTVMDEVFAVVAEEQAKVRQLVDEGLLGSIYLATAARGTVFLETFADDAEAAADIVRTLPMAKWWDLDVYPLNPPREVAS
ncbi:MAG: muconolactone Delta-isomerase family protein [Acidimicrobiia bacterium]